jgi:hypothetical protein
VTLTWFDRLYLALGWKRLEGKMTEKMRRWLPLIGAAILATIVLLRALGWTEAAAMIETIVGTVGLTKDSPVSVSELLAAVAAVTGIALKIRAEIKKVVAK